MNLNFNCAHIKLGAFALYPDQISDQIGKVIRSPQKCPIYSRFFISIVGLLIGCALLPANERLPYNPKQNIPFSEQWRWSTIEALNEYYIFTGTEDKDGLLWFAATHGLISYDGYKIDEIKYPDELINAEIYDLEVSAQEIYYIATNKGMYRYSNNEWRQMLEYSQSLPHHNDLFARTQSGTFFSATGKGLFQIISDETTLVAFEGKDVIQIKCDHQDNLWVVVRKTQSIIKIPTLNGNITSQDNWETYSFLEEEGFDPRIIINSKNNDIWSINGVMTLPPHRYDDELKTFIRVHSPKMNYGHSAGVSLNTSELILVSKSTSILHLYAYDEWQLLKIDPKRFPLNGIYMFLRKNGNLIIGGRGEKILQVDLAGEKWESYQGLHFQCSDYRSHNWFLSIDGEVIEEDAYGQFYKWTNKEIIDTPCSIFASQDGMIWVSGSHKKIASISRYDGQSWVRDMHPRMNRYFSYLSPLETSEHEIWFGAGYEYQSDVGGLTRYKKVGKTYEFDYLESPTVPSRISCITETTPGNFYFGGLHLFQFHENKSELIELKDFPKIRWIDHIISDENGELWMAIWQLGIFKKNNENWDRIKAPDQIAHKQTVYILPDKNRPRALWIATQGGVSYFDGEDWIPMALPEDFAITREGGTLKQSNDGSLWCNFALREWYFRRDSQTVLSDALRQEFKTIRYTPDTEPPMLTINEGRTQYTSPANVYLSWQAIDPWSSTSQDKLTYSWRLNGGNWSTFAKEQDLLLLDQKAGTYHFEVMARDLDGNRSNIISFPIIQIDSPIWQRSWFILLIILTTFLLLVLTTLLIRQKIKQIVKFEEFKIQFFANMSHELCTPLTVIMGPLQRLVKKCPDNEERKPIELAYRNAKKMLHTIEQILDFRSSEYGRVQLNDYEGDIVSTVSDSIDLVSLLADEKGQRLIFVSNFDRYVTLYDAEKLTKIIDNLISNSIKYTPEDGNIQIQLQITKSSHHDEVKIIVEDDGFGIPKHQLKNVFDPFYRAKNRKLKKISGTGLGLAVTKNLVECCGGKISVESPVSIVDGKMIGTRFKIKLSLKKPNSHKTEPFTDETETPQSNQDEELTEFSENPLILLIEDQSDIRQMLKYELTNYNIQFAENGLEGFDKAKNLVPDLIVSDILMPKLSGLELVKKIRENTITSHIPVILLTALKNEIKGLEMGADDYITKPFDLEVFQKRVETLLKNRKIQQQKYEATPSGSFDYPAIAMSSTDQNFIQHAQQTTISNLANPLFDVQSLAEELNMSRMTLYRKFKGLTGESPSHFIKLVRMNKATELLLSGANKITEISEMVGVPVSSQFSSMFKKQFNCTPSQYLKRNKKNKKSDKLNSNVL